VQKGRGDGVEPDPQVFGFVCSGAWEQTRCHCLAALEVCLTLFLRPETFLNTVPADFRGFGFFGVYFVILLKCI